MTPLTLAEIRLRHAQLVERAERLRAQSASMSAASRSSLATIREARRTQIRANDYAAILEWAEKEKK